MCHSRNRLPALMKLSENKPVMLILAITSAILIAIFIIRPSVIGYNTYLTLEKSNYSIDSYGLTIDDLNSQLIEVNANLSSCNTYYNKVLTVSENCWNELSACNININTAALALDYAEKNCQNNIAQLEKELAEKDNELYLTKANYTQEITNLNLQYENLAKNIARSVCCKEKVDNPDIRYYAIVNNKITCIKDGELELVC